MRKPLRLKVCPRCRHSLPLNAFRRIPRRPGGRAGYCQDCRLDYDRAWRAKRREDLKRWREAFEREQALRTGQ